VKPVNFKSETIRELITKAARDNLLFKPCTVRDLATYYYYYYYYMSWGYE